MSQGAKSFCAQVSVCSLQVVNIYIYISIKKKTVYLICFYVYWGIKAFTSVVYMVELPKKELKMAC